MAEFGELTENKKQLELELTQEEFVYRQIDQQKNVAIVGVIVNIALVIIVTGALWFITANSVFSMVVGPLLIMIWLVFLGIVIRSEAKDVKKLLTNGFEKEKMESFEKCRKLRLRIEELEGRLEQVQVTRWNS